LDFLDAKEKTPFPAAWQRLAESHFVPYDSQLSNLHIQENSKNINPLYIIKA